MYCCGLRISEAVCLQPWQIDRQQQTIRIIGKGNKERLVPLPPWGVAILSGKAQANSRAHLFQ